MYASFRSVTAKNGKILTPTRTGNFLLTSMDPEFYATKMFRYFFLTTKATQLRPQVFSVNGSIICNFGCTFDVIRPIWPNSSKFGEQQLVMMNYACDLTNQKRRNILNE